MNNLMNVAAQALLFGKVTKLHSLFCSSPYCGKEIGYEANTYDLIRCAYCGTLNRTADCDVELEVEFA